MSSICRKTLFIKEFYFYLDFNDLELKAGGVFLQNLISVID